MPPLSATSTLCATQQAGVKKNTKIKTAKWLTRIIFLTRNSSGKNGSAFVSKNERLVQGRGSVKLTLYLVSASSDPGTPGSRAFRQTFIAEAMNPTYQVVSHLR